MTTKFPKLKKEVDETVLFFAQMDMQLYGHITQETVDIFEIQNTAFPPELEKLVK